MTKNLLIRLIFPLLILFFVSMLLHFVWELDGFFLNLATEVIGIIITVSYVDWILNQHDKQKWLITDKKVADRLTNLLISMVTVIRTGLNLGTDILDESVLVSNDPIKMHKEIIRLAEHVIPPILSQCLYALTAKDWKSLDTNIAVLNGHILTFLNLFQARLSPQQISDLLDLQEALSNSRYFYTTFPDLAGVPKENLPQSRTPPEILQKSGYESTSKELKKALSMAKTISQSITQDI